MDRNELEKGMAENDEAVRAFINSCVHNMSAAEDIMQDVWRTVMTKLDLYDCTRPFKAWVFGIARMQILKWKQSAARCRESPSSEVIDLLATTAEEHADELDRRAAYIMPCLAKLSPSSRTMLQMRYYEGLKSTEIAARLGKNASAVDMAMTRARRELRDLINSAMAQDDQKGD